MSSMSLGPAAMQALYSLHGLMASQKNQTAQQAPESTDQPSDEQQVYRPQIGDLVVTGRVNPITGRQEVWTLMGILSPDMEITQISPDQVDPETGRIHLNLSKETLAYLNEQKDYRKARSAFSTEQSLKKLDIMDKLRAESGGLLDKCIFNPSDLSEPIRSLDNHLHPQADEILDFLKAHQSEMDQLATLTNTKFPSYEEWRASQSTVSLEA